MNDLYQRTAGLRTGERLTTAMVSVRPAKFPPKGAATDQNAGTVRKTSNRKGGSTTREKNTDRGR